jgi:hypothetical protein
MHIRRLFSGAPVLDELQRLMTRDETRARSITRFLHQYCDRKLYFMTQTFNPENGFAWDNERAARSRLAGLKKWLRSRGDFVLVWERGDKTNHIHAHIVFALDHDFNFWFEYSLKKFKAVMDSEVGFLHVDPIRYLNYRRISGYLSAYVSKDRRYRFTSSIRLRDLPPLGFYQGWVSAAPREYVGDDYKRHVTVPAWREMALRWPGKGRGGNGLMFPPRPMTFTQCHDEPNTFICDNSEQISMLFDPPAERLA